MSGRAAQFTRETAETKIAVRIDLDGSGNGRCDTGLGFLDHMLNQLAKHGRFDLEVSASGDLGVDSHHTTEDVAIALGRCFGDALGERRGIVRMGHAIVPLDEALAMVAVDIGGRGYAVVAPDFAGLRLGELDADLIRHFLETFAVEARISLHATVMHGHNDHHKAEAIFKSLARALDQATRLDPRLGDAVPSTKGIIEGGS